jgi:hypothetical protein
VGGELSYLIRENHFSTSPFQPFDESYHWDNSSANMIVADLSKSRINGFVGNIIQEATSVVTKTNQRCYELVEGCYSIYGFEVHLLPSSPGYL